MKKNHCLDDFGGEGLNRGQGGGGAGNIHQ